MYVWLIERVVDGFVSSGRMNYYKKREFVAPDGERLPKAYSKIGPARSVITSLAIQDYDADRLSWVTERWGDTYWTNPEYHKQRPAFLAWWQLSEEERDAWRSAYLAVRYELVRS